MNRRDLLLIGGATAVAHGLSTVAGCAARVAPGTTPPPAVGGATGALITAASDCISAGEACQAHCIRLLSEGTTSMAECARKVTDMLAICRAVPTLAASGSPHLRAMVELCVAVCTDCEAACRPHAGHHAECRACMEACAASIAAGRALLG